jgi:cutinase-like protein
VDRNGTPIDIGSSAPTTHDRPVRAQGPVCSSGRGFSRAAHSAYKPNGMPEQAADFTAAAIKAIH